MSKTIMQFLAQNGIGSHGQRVWLVKNKLLKCLRVDETGRMDSDVKPIECPTFEMQPNDQVFFLTNVPKGSFAVSLNEEFKNNSANHKYGPYSSRKNAFEAITRNTESPEVYIAKWEPIYISSVSGETALEEICTDMKKYRPNKWIDNIDEQEEFLLDFKIDYAIVSWLLTINKYPLTGAISDIQKYKTHCNICSSINVFTDNKTECPIHK